MSVGLPGSGLGGMFYLFSALWMPFDSAGRAVRRKRPARVRLVARQTLLALGIVAALFATGWMIELLIELNASVVAFISGTVAPDKVEIPRVLRTATFAIGITTLGGVLLSVQVMRWLFAPKAKSVAPPAIKPAPAKVRKVA